MDAEEVLAMAKKRIEGEKLSARSFASANGISQPYFSQILSGKRPMPDKLLDALGVERVVTYRRKAKTP